VLRHGSAELVALAEAKLAGERVEAADLTAAVQPLLDQPGGAQMDVVVLACTHFPLLAEELAGALPGVAQVDGGGGIARRIAHLTQGQPWPVQPAPGIAVFTGPPPPERLAGALGSYELHRIEHL
jgi:glutamate racemase